MLNTLPIEPRLVVLPTRDIVQRFREDMLSLNTVDYDLNELGSVVVSALCRLEDIATAPRSVADHFASQYDPHDAPQAHVAYGRLTTDLRSVIQTWDGWDSSGVIGYHFERWLADDLVLRHLPY